ncbi:hypothetical protein V6N13_125914 [Hibiscus sabdariffa]
MVCDNGLDGLGIIVAKRAGEIRFPAVRLSEIPAKHSENRTTEHIKVAIKLRPNNGSVNEANHIGMKRCPVRSVEERKEEYDRARARIFSSPSSPDSDDSSLISIDGKNEYPIRDDCENFRSSVVDPEKNIYVRDGTSRVAILRDREKDRYDPDYDRSYQRYVRSIPCNQSFGLAPHNMLLPFMQYDSAFPQLGQIASTQPTLSYGVPARPAVSPFCDMGLNPTSRDGAYMKWPSATMMYLHPYDHFRHAVTQLLRFPHLLGPISFDAFALLCFEDKLRPFVKSSGALAATVESGTAVVAADVAMGATIEETSGDVVAKLNHDVGSLGKGWSDLFLGQSLPFHAPVELDGKILVQPPR